jgi:DNA-binding CsgD family transcriptional regulator
VKQNQDFAQRHERLDPAALLERARFRECLDVLNGDASPRAVLIRMRAMLLLGEHHTIVRSDFLDTIANLPQSERALAMGLLSMAYFRSDMRLPAENARNEAYRLAKADEPGILAEIRYYHAFQAWSDHNLDLATRLLDQVMAEADLRAKALELRGWIASRTSDYSSQITYLRAAWNAIRRQDVWTRAAILHALSVLAREMFDDSLAQFIESNAATLEWTDETREKEFYVYRHLGWCAALGGRSLVAFQHFARAETSAISEPTRVLLDLDRSYIARWNGERLTDDASLMRAQIRANEVDWKRCGESRMALLIMAELTAPKDAQQAKTFLDRYCAIETPFSKALPFGNGDRRRRAHEEYTAGVVYRALGLLEEAKISFKTAFGIWRGIGYKWRAGLAAYNLGQITVRAHYFDAARLLIDESVPNAFFARILEPYRKRFKDSIFAELPQGQKDVLIAFLDGMSNKQIAERLGISEPLVKRRLSQTYRAFGATTSREILPILRERGIV